MLNQQQGKWNFLRFKSRTEEEIKNDENKTLQELGYPEFDRPVWVLVEEDVHCMNKEEHEADDEAPFIVDVKLVHSESFNTKRNCQWEYINPIIDSGMEFKYIHQNQTVVAWRYKV